MQYAHVRPAVFSGPAQPVCGPGAAGRQGGDRPREEHRPLPGTAGAGGKGLSGRRDNPARKTRYDLVAVEKGELLVNLDSQAPNKVFAQWAQAGGFRPGLTLLRPETTWGNSRFDFYWEDAAGQRGFVEVKGVTLEEEGHVRFPDAPTLRGVKHLEELVRARAEGYETAVCFVVQMEGMVDFAPNDATHPAFGAALRRAAAAGVTVLAMECAVTPGSLAIRRSIPVRL